MAHKYVCIWEKELPFILSAIENGTSEKQLLATDFQRSGNRPKSGYGFSNLHIINGNVPTKKNSAVARDLKIVLDDSKKFSQMAKGKQILIRMTKEFVLAINTYETI